MALQVWLPLNGNLNNHGLFGNLSFTEEGSVAYSDNGKTGRCIEFTGGYYRAPFAFTLGNSASIAGWVYYNSRPSSSSNDWMFQAGTSSGFSNTVLGIVTYYNRISLCIAGSYADYSYTLKTGTWYHIAATWDGSVANLFLNGSQVASWTTLNTGTKKTSNRLALGSNVAGTTTRLKGRLNDVRLYDHCLSPKEVREISQALILHYPLNTREIALSKCSNVTFNQLLTNGNFISDFGWVNAYNCTYSISNNIITITKNADAGIGGICKATPLSVYTTHKYYFKGTIRCSSIDEGRTGSCFGFHGSNGYVSGNSQAFNYTTEWETLSVLTSTTSNTNIFAIRAGTSASNVGFSIQCKNIILVDLTLMFGSGKEPSKEDCDKIFINDYYEYNEGTPTNLVEPIKDCSGYKYDGIIEGDASLFSDSPRYNNCAFFSEDATITSYNALINYETPFSFSLWCNFENSNANFALRGRSLTKIFNFGVNSNNYQFVIFTPPLGYFGVQGGTVKTGWHHYAGVYNGTTANLYIDGKLEIEQNIINNTYQTNVPTEQFLRIHDSGWNESLQTVDVRLYSTALSDEDIADLYHTSALIDNKGDFYSFQLKEENENLLKYENTLLYTNPANTQTRGKYTTRNDILAMAFKATDTYFGQSSDKFKLLYGMFKENTQYIFDMWIDTDDVIYDGRNVTDGFVVWYTDGTKSGESPTSNGLIVRGANPGETPKGFQHKIYISEFGKTIRSLNIYYYTSITFYVRADSYITELTNTEIYKNGITQTGQFVENTDVAFIGKADVNANEFVEI